MQALKIRIYVLLVTLFCVISLASTQATSSLYLPVTSSKHLVYKEDAIMFSLEENKAIVNPNLSHANTCEIAKVKNHLKANIAKADIRKTFDVCLDSVCPNSKLYNEIVLCSFRYYSLEQEKRKGFIKFEDASILENQIAHSLLNLVDDMGTSNFRGYRAATETKLLS